MKKDPQDIGPFRTAIIAVFPELAGASLTLMTAGWDCVAVDACDRLIFKFPRNEAARRALVREAALLAHVRPHVAMPVPDLAIHDGPPLFSSHAKLKGEHLLSAHYATLAEPLRQRLGEEMARFYAELHQLDTARMAAAGARPAESWLTPEAVRAKALPALPDGLRARALATIDAYARLGPDPYGEIYGYFDGHGWNMAFDHGRGRLNGLYDFADSGIGPLHREFISSSFIDMDLTARIMAAYERLTERSLDRERIAVLTGFHRLSELAALAHEPAHRQELVGYVSQWAAAN